MKMAEQTNSCKLRVRWDWADSATSGKWSRQEEIWREVRPMLEDPEDHEGYPVVVTKNKVRGTGQALQTEFVSEAGKACVFYGWGVELAAKSKM